jgi:hypothetical protein
MFQNASFKNKAIVKNKFLNFICIIQRGKSKHGSNKPFVMLIKSYFKGIFYIQSTRVINCQFDQLSSNRTVAIVWFYGQEKEAKNAFDFGILLKKLKKKHFVCNLQSLHTCN